MEKLTVGAGSTGQKVLVEGFAGVEESKGDAMVNAFFLKVWASKKLDVPLHAILGLDNSCSHNGQENKYFFPSPILNQRLSILKNMVGGSSYIITVIGERGSGKTTLMKRLIEAADKGWRVCRIRLKTDNKDALDMWRNLNNRMAHLSYNNTPPSLIIDDAHQLTPLELKLLLQTAFPEGGRRKIQNLVLFAEPQMRERFSEMVRYLPQFAVIDKFNMTPLSEKQTADYLCHRIKIAGFLKGIPFSGEQIRKIHNISGGLPGWINGEAYMLLRRLFGGRRVNTPRFRILRQNLYGWCHRLSGPFVFYKA